MRINPDTQTPTYNPTATTGQPPSDNPNRVHRSTHVTLDTNGEIVSQESFEINCPICLIPLVDAFKYIYSFFADLLSSLFCYQQEEEIPLPPPNQQPLNEESLNNENAVPVDQPLPLEEDPNDATEQTNQEIEDALAFAHQLLTNPSAISTATISTSPIEIDTTPSVEEYKSIIQKILEKNRHIAPFEQSTFKDFVVLLNEISDARKKFQVFDEIINKVLYHWGSVQAFIEMAKHEEQKPANEPTKALNMGILEYIACTDILNVINNFIRLSDEANISRTTTEKCKRPGSYIHDKLYYRLMPMFVGRGAFTTSNLDPNTPFNQLTRKWFELGSYNHGRGIITLGCEHSTTEE